MLRQFARNNLIFPTTIKVLLPTQLPFSALWVKKKRETEDREFCEYLLYKINKLKRELKGGRFMRRHESAGFGIYVIKSIFDKQGRSVSRIFLRCNFMLRNKCYVISAENTSFSNTMLLVDNIK